MKAATEVMMGGKLNSLGTILALAYLNRFKVSLRHRNWADLDNMQRK